MNILHNPRHLYLFWLFLICISCNQAPKIEPNETIETSTQSISSQVHDDAKTERRIHPTDNEVINIAHIDKKLRQFVLKEYSVLNLATGDLNKDGLLDKIMVLVKNGEEITSNAYEDKPDLRPMLLILGKKNHKYELVHRNDNAIYCIECGGGIWGDAFLNIVIKNGYFSIEHGIFAGRHWTKTTTFKYDTMQNNWFLYKDRYIHSTFDVDKSGDGDLISDMDTLLTVKDFGIIPFEKFNIYNENMVD
jgi:hypothetical protein